MASLAWLERKTDWESHPVRQNIHLIIEKYKYYLCADPLDTLWIHFLLSWGPIALFWLMAPTVPP